MAPAPEREVRNECGGAIASHFAWDDFALPQILVLSTALSPGFCDLCLLAGKLCPGFLE